MKSVIATLIIALLYTKASLAASFSGKVVKISDGGTVSVMHNGRSLCKMAMLGITRSIRATTR